MTTLIVGVRWVVGGGWVVRVVRARFTRPLRGGIVSVVPMVGYLRPGVIVAGGL